MPNGRLISSTWANIALCFHLPFSDHIHRLVACQRALLHRVKGEKNPTAGMDAAAFDEAVILLDQVVEVLFDGCSASCR
jgi:anti-sigma factor ChrR (cupin superfamily)